VAATTRIGGTPGWLLKKDMVRWKRSITQYSITPISRYSRRFSSPVGPFGAAPVELEGHGVEVGGNRTDRIAEPLGLEGDETAARRTGQAQPLLTADEKHLAIEQSVIKILSGRHHVAELAMAAGLDADTPASLEKEHAAGRREILIVWDF